MAFAFQKLLSFMRSHLFIVDLSVCAIGVIFKEWSPVPMHFSSIRSSVGGFMLRPLIHLDLSFEHGDRYGSVCILLHVDIQLYQHHLLKMLSFFHCIILATMSKIKCPCVYGLISGSLILSCWSTCLFLCQF